MCLCLEIQTIGSGGSRNDALSKINNSTELISRMMGDSIFPREVAGFAIMGMRIQMYSNDYN